MGDYGGWGSIVIRRAGWPMNEVDGEGGDDGRVAWLVPSEAMVGVVAGNVIDVPSVAWWVSSEAVVGGGASSSFTSRTSRTES